jgi:hypothetical protein
VSDLDRDIQEALERAGADDLGAPRARHYREAQPMPDRPDWGPLRIVQPATPWPLVGVGALLWLVGRMLGRAALGDPLEIVGVLLVLVGILSLVCLPRSQPKRWRGRLIDLDDSWRARLYRRIYRR